ncbi:HSP20 family protein [Natronorubrum sediminis]|uniref:HSP20 family protein n=1 Tax=Natronorubrum sediminis TaxID=640943 RepID=A0A1H6G510_9EURY|nr:Hsp20/alpha crystallin family protein [Natronorubrum sediminis]SEH18129.1 HSP20 family protein [Natronorubrum sediminis]
MTDGNTPFEGLEKQFERLQRQFEDVTRTWNFDRFGFPEMEAASMGIDLVDRGDEFVLTADVPGFERDEIDVRLSDSTLSITAEHEEEMEEREELYLKSERAHRAISRSVRLPESIDEDGISATYNNGVLTLTLPKVEPTEVGGNKIEVE